VGLLEVVMAWRGRRKEPHRGSRHSSVREALLKGNEVECHAAAGDTDGSSLRKG